VRLVDQIVFLKDGKLITKGTFEEVRESVPDFRRQAALLGL